VDVRFGAHNGLKSDIAACPGSANRRYDSITLWNTGEEDTLAEKLATSSRRYILIASESAVSCAAFVRNRNLMRSPLAAISCAPQNSAASVIDASLPSQISANGSLFSISRWCSCFSIA
jgi:hypothetical protein